MRVMSSHLGPFQACTPNTVAKQIKRTYAYLKRRCPNLPVIAIREPMIDADYVGNGYGVPTRAGSQAYHLMHTREGITLDPTYSTKTFAAALDYCRRHQADRGPVLFWNTYNSVDLSGQAKQVDYRILPESLQGFIKQKSVDF